MMWAVAARPRLWSTALAAARRLVPSRWWTQPPFLPIPDGEYLRFRLVTARGSDQRTATADTAGACNATRSIRVADLADLADTADAADDRGDLIEWLDWCRRLRPAMATRSRGEMAP